MPRRSPLCTKAEMDKEDFHHGTTVMVAKTATKLPASSESVAGATIRPPLRIDQLSQRKTTSAIYILTDAGPEHWFANPACTFFHCTTVLFQRDCAGIVPAKALSSNRLRVE